MTIKISEIILALVIWRGLNFSDNTFMYTVRVLIILSVGSMIAYGHNTIEWIAFLILIFAPTIVKYINILTHTNKECNKIEVDGEK